jgi:starvation-inducible DNA-binding protein
MDKLLATLRIAIGNTFTMYFKSHSYHWNVEGMLFSEFHAFFGDLYLDLHGAVDPLA